MHKVGLILDADSFKNIKELSIRAEKANFHSIWTTELYRTSFQQLSTAASVTSKIKLGTAVALAFARTPLITSITSLDLDEFSNGRLILGLGSGARRTNENFHGVEYGKPVAKIKECVELIRLITSDSHTGKDIIYNGEFYKINTKGFKRPFKPLRELMPLYLAGIGPNMVQASAECADGYIGHVVCSLNYLKQVVLPSINKGLKKVKKPRNNFTVSSIITCAVSDDIKKAMNAAKYTIAFYSLVKTYRQPFEIHGFGKQCEKIREAYFKNDIEGMKKNVTDDMVEVFSIVGSAKECLERLSNYIEVIDLPILSAPHYYIDFKEVKEYQNNLVKTFGQ